MADLPNMNFDELAVFKSLAGSNDDGPVLMLNLNRYRPEPGYPNGTLYREYMKVLDQLVAEVVGRISWRTNIQGTLVGTQDVHEALGIWYPSHQAFLDIITAPAAARNMELRAKAAEQADLHRCDP